MGRAGWAGHRHSVSFHPIELFPRKGNSLGELARFRRIRNRTPSLKTVQIDGYGRNGRYTDSYGQIEIQGGMQSKRREKLGRLAKLMERVEQHFPVESPLSNLKSDEYDTPSLRFRGAPRQATCDRRF